MSLSKTIQVILLVGLLAFITSVNINFTIFMMGFITFAIAVTHFFNP